MYPELQKLWSAEARGKKKAKTQESLLIYFLLLVTFVKLQIKQKCSDSKKNVWLQINLLSQVFKQAYLFSETHSNPHKWFLLQSSISVAWEEVRSRLRMATSFFLYCKVYSFRKRIYAITFYVGCMSSFPQWQKKKYDPRISAVNSAEC